MATPIIVDYSNLLVAEQSIELKVAQHHGRSFNHCSSLCAFNDGVIIAWYSGKSECHTNQAVYVIFINSNSISNPLKLEDGSGNPTVWSSNGKIYIIYSKFGHTPFKLIDKWKYCTNIVAELILHNNFLTIARHTKVPWTNLLSRCNPINVNGTVYVPLYNELKRHGVIFKAVGATLTELGTIGMGMNNNGMIQPTIWYDGKFNSLSRTFHSNLTHAHYSQSVDGAIWSTPQITTIPNNNSSLHTLRWHGHNLIIWNNTTSRLRSNLCLGLIRNIEAVALVKLADFGSYPSMCVDAIGNLHVTFTCDQVIKHHSFDRDSLLTIIESVSSTKD